MGPKLSCRTHFFSSSFPFSHTRLGCRPLFLILSFFPAWPKVGLGGHMLGYLITCWVWLGCWWLGVELWWPSVRLGDQINIAVFFFFLLKLQSSLSASSSKFSSHNSQWSITLWNAPLSPYVLWQDFPILGEHKPTKWTPSKLIQLGWI